MHRFVSLVAPVGLAVCLSSCGSESQTGTPTAPDTAVPTVVAIELSGISTLAIGQQTTYVATARLSTSASRPVAGGTWGTDAPAIVSIDNTGRVAALAPGSATIWVDAEGRRGTLSIAVKGGLFGTWILESTNRPSTPSGVGIATKSFTETDWVFNQNDPATGGAVFRHGGRYTLSGTEYVEQVDFANASTAHLVGQTFTFTVTFDGDTHRQTGLCCGGGRGGAPPFFIDSIWRRVR